MSRPVASLRAAWSLARRDLVEFLRDRRTVVVTLLLPMITYPLVALSSALGVRNGLESATERKAATPLALVMSGPGSPLLAARLGALLMAAGDSPPPEWPSDVYAEIEPAERAQELLEAGKVDLWIDVPTLFAESLLADDTFELEARVADSQPATSKTRDQFRSLINDLAEQIRNERMELAGIPSSLFDPIRLSFVGKPVPKAGLEDSGVIGPLAGAILVLLAVLTMTGAFYPAIDAIAGEKERGTIETLLIVPCDSIDIVLGKFLAVFGVTLATLAANVVSILLTIFVSLRFLPTGSTGHLLQHLGQGGFLTLLAFIGLAAVAAAMSLAVTTASKSVKEAQNTLTPVILLVSALAGVAIVPGIRSDGIVSAIPFTGQVVVSRTALTPPPQSPDSEYDETIPEVSLDRLQSATSGPSAALLPLLVTLLSSGLTTWLLLRGTAALLTDEEILFRGPDAASGFHRPARRQVPGVVHGGIALALGLAGLWYVQGISPENIVLAIPVQQLAVVLPLLLLLVWQRVSIRQTFSLRWPGGGRGVGKILSGLLALAGGILVGGGIFILGAAAILQFGNLEMSPAMKALSENLLALMLEQPWWLAWLLMAVLPACLEELLFRGWVLAAFIGKHPSRKRMVIAVFIQAGCFAVFHLLPERMPQTFLLGLALGSIVLATGSILPAILCHIANNSMPLLLLYGSGVNGRDALPARLAEELGQLSLPPQALALAAGAIVIGGSLLAWTAWRRRTYATGKIISLLFVLGCMSCLSEAWAADLSSVGEVFNKQPITEPADQQVRVATMPTKSVGEYVDEQPRGYSIDLWTELAQRLDLRTRYVRMDSIKELFAGTSTGQVDVLLEQLAMTE